MAETFNVNRETVRRWCRERKIGYIKLPGTKGEYRFSKEEIENFISALNMKAAVRFPKYPKDEKDQSKAHDKD